MGLKVSEALELQHECFVIFRVAVLVIVHADNGLFDRKLLHFLFRQLPRKKSSWVLLQLDHCAFAALPAGFEFLNYAQLEEHEIHRYTCFSAVFKEL